ncbi:hypothetical protein EON62_00420 [archaeon]|nr:MAG: hypothetical protein EON62_00420 [archaeon]
MQELRPWSHTVGIQRDPQRMVEAVPEHVTHGPVQQLIVRVDSDATHRLPARQVQHQATLGGRQAVQPYLQPGDTRVSFKGPLGAFKIDLSPAYAPSSRIRRIGLIAGGTGIAPMSQILRSALFHKRHDIPIKLIYAASAPNQFAFLELLRRKVELHPQFEMLCTVDRVPPGQVWNGVCYSSPHIHTHTRARARARSPLAHFVARMHARAASFECVPVCAWHPRIIPLVQSVGFVNEALLREFMFPPGDDLQIVVCGPYPMCQSLKQILPAMGYTKEMFFSYM